MMLIGAVVVLVAVAAARFGARIGMPALLLFLFLGMFMGSNLIHVDFQDAALAHDLGFAALVMILAEGGLTTKWSEIKPFIGLAGALATAGIAVSIGLMSLFGYYVLHLPLAVAVLLGAVTAPTDAAAVFSILRGLPLPARVRATLEAESGLNDAPTVLLVAAGTNYALGQTPNGGVLGLGGMIVLELTGGLVLGLVLGLAGVWVLRRVALPVSGLYPIATLAWAVTAYGLGVWLHLSGFAAVYVCAMVLGNGNLPHRHATRSFAEGVGWISQIGLFIMLGLLSIHESIDRSDIIVGVAAGLFLTLVARPLSVLLSASWFKVPWREQVFLSWAGLRGAVPIILATVPLAARINDAVLLFDVVVVFVIVFTAIQAPTLPWAARKLGLIDPLAAYDLDIEVAPLEDRRADLLQIKVPKGSKLAGVTIRELRLPEHVVVSLVMRGDEEFSPDIGTMLRIGDELLIVTPSNDREWVEQRLSDVGRRGRLANWKR